MKKILAILFSLTICVCSFAQSYDSPSSSDLRKYSVTQDTKVAFRLFPTQNIWNFMKLDTRTGQIWMVQYTVEEDGDSFTWTIDDTKIEEPKSENIGRFTLYPTSNSWNFILLDQINGRTWQVQFSLKNADNNFRHLIQ